MTNYNNILQELYKFSNDVIYLGNEINDNRIEIFEKQINFKIPNDFKYILKKHNGISLFGTEFYGLDDNLKESSLDKIYSFETSNEMPLYLLPFSPDGRGNHYCLNLSKINNDICPVVFWQSDFNYKNNNEIEICNNSFIDWINEVMIEWILEDYNYDGSEK